MLGVSGPFLCRKACSEQWLFACVLLEEFNTQHLQGTLGGSDSAPPVSVGFGPKPGRKLLYPN